MSPEFLIATDECSHRLGLVQRPTQIPAREPGQVGADSDARIVNYCRAQYLLALENPDTFKKQSRGWSFLRPLSKAASCDLYPSSEAAFEIGDDDSGVVRVCCALGMRIECRCLWPGEFFQLACLAELSDGALGPEYYTIEGVACKPAVSELPIRPEIASSAIWQRRAGVEGAVERYLTRRQRGWRSSGAFIASSGKLDQLEEFEADAVVQVLSDWAVRTHSATIYYIADMAVIELLSREFLRSGLQGISEMPLRFAVRVVHDALGWEETLRLVGSRITATDQVSVDHLLALVFLTDLDTQKVTKLVKPLVDRWQGPIPIQYMSPWIRVLCAAPADWMHKWILEIALPSLIAALPRLSCAEIHNYCSSLGQLLSVCDFDWKDIVSLGEKGGVEESTAEFSILACLNSEDENFAEYVWETKRPRIVNLPSPSDQLSAVRGFPEFLVPPQAEFRQSLTNLLLSY